jgi:chromosome segregation ATPase
MADEMASDSERDAAGNSFQNLEATIRQLRAAAVPPPVPAESWLKKTLSPAAPSSHQNEFNAAVVDALNQLASALRETTTSQEKRLGQLAEDLRELRAISEDMDAFREHTVRIEGELRSIGSNVRGLQERSAALEGEVARSREEQLDKVRQLTEQQGDLRREFEERVRQVTDQQEDLRREFQERIQHLLDEQRVCIRQLSLQASEEAVLADRARRAAELKLEELARRVPPPPA